MDLPERSLPDTPFGDDRDQSLEEINTHLRHHKLAPLTHLGAERDGFYIRAFRGTMPDDNRWYKVVRFATIGPSGERGLYFMVFAVKGETHRGVVVIPMITHGGKRYVVFVRQHRPTLLVDEDKSRCWTTELPREFASSAALSSIGEHVVRQSINEKPITYVLGRELAPLFLSGKVAARSWKRLSKTPEDTGKSTTIVHTYFIDLELTEGATMEEVMAIRGTRSMGIRYYLLSDVLEDYDNKLGIDDCHTNSALFLLRKHLRI